MLSIISDPPITPAAVAAAVPRNEPPAEGCCPIIGACAIEGASVR
jgi:hypothetical protein